LKKFMAESLSPILGEELGVREKSAIVLGAGGSARAVVYALLRDGWRLTIAARRIEQAQQLAPSFPDYKLRITPLSDLQLSTFNLLVNTTPLGMTPNVDQSPLAKDTLLSKHTLIYDLVYNPRETKLVKDARVQGLQATTGLGMLIEQAALAFDLWTGYNPPREKLWDAVETDQKSLINGD
jgi:shikimate dehydrogenase